VSASKSIREAILVYPISDHTNLIIYHLYTSHKKPPPDEHVRLTLTPSHGGTVEAFSMIASISPIFPATSKPRGVQDIILTFLLGPALNFLTTIKPASSKDRREESTAHLPTPHPLMKAYWGLIVIPAGRLDTNRRSLKAAPGSSSSLSGFPFMIRDSSLGVKNHRMMLTSYIVRRMSTNRTLYASYNRSL
jgi:hypothetical protein